MGLLLSLLKNPIVTGLITEGIEWGIGKIHGAKATSLPARATAALGEAAAIMTQFAITEPAETTAEQMILKFKGIVAITFAKAKIYESDRVLFQPLIDRAIAEAVTQWMKLHPTRTSPPPIARKL